MLEGGKRVRGWIEIERVDRDREWIEIERVDRDRECA